MKHDQNLCTEIQSTLPLYVGGDLESKALSEVRGHLGECPACAERALSARAARRELVAALRIESRPGPDLWAGVRAALVDEGVLRPAGTPFEAARARRRTLGWSAAAAAVVLSFWVGASWKGGDVPAPEGGSPPIVREDPREIPRIPLAAVTPTTEPSAPNLAQVPDEDLGGLRRLVPGERPLRDSALPILDSGAHIQGVPVSRQPGVHPVGLQRVGPDTPRW